MLEDLQTIKLFQNVSDAQLAEIGRYCELKMLSDGEILIAESSRSDIDLYLLISGCVEIVSRGAPNTSQEVVISNQDKELFGEIAFLTHSPRTASVRCRGDVQAIRVDGAALKGYMDEHPDAGYQIMRNIAETLAHRVSGADNLLKQILWNTSL